jgi:hypothetical protein
MIASIKGIGPKTDYAGKGQQHICTKDRPVLSSERAPHKNQDRNCQESNKYLIMTD